MLMASTAEKASVEYRLSDLEFEPDWVLDVGACVGHFSVAARCLWPDAKIVAVEPDTDNFESLVDNTRGMGVVYIKGALGVQPIYRLEGLNEQLHSYISYMRAATLPISVHTKLVKVDVNAFELNDLVHCMRGAGLVKIDCEFGDTAAQTHEATEVLKTVRAWRFEKHFIDERDPEYFGGWLHRFADTHDVDAKLWRAGALVWAENRTRRFVVRYGDADN